MVGRTHFNEWQEDLVAKDKHAALKAAHAKAMQSHAQTGKSLEDIGQMIAAMQQQPQQPAAPAMSAGVSPLGGQAT